MMAHSITFLLLTLVSAVSGNTIVPVIHPACLFSCPSTELPVCGNDINTYTNECMMRKTACTKQNAIIAVYQGHCRDEKNFCAFVCPKSYAPVCGSDAAKYSSECHLRLAACKERKAITVVRNNSYAIHNKCGSKETCEIPCLKSDFKAVCGSDLKTYSNECMMRVEACKSRTAIIQLYGGPCKTK